MIKNNPQKMPEVLRNSMRDCEPLFLKFILERLGIIIHAHQTNDLYKTVFEAYKIFNLMPQEYLQILKTCSDKSPMLEHLIVGITVGETYFFRDKRQMEMLQNSLLPTIIKTKLEQKNLFLRMWSAGCATGEEIYTLAILLCEMLPDINAWTLNMLGTDINMTSLKKALQGQYSEWSMRSIPDHIKKKYFQQTNHYYMIAEKIRDLVNFEYLNLSDDDYPSIFNGTNSQDLILCRNVLIYFDNEHVMRLMKKISASLIPGGYLLLGASDPIDIKATNLIFHHTKGLLFSRPILETEMLDPKIASIKTTKIDNAPVIHTKISNTPAYSPKKVQKIDIEVINQLLNSAQWQKLLDIVCFYEKNHSQTTLMLSAKAIALANLGHLQEAAKLFQTSFVIDPTNKINYFTYALTMLELNQLAEAEKALRKTLFLDHQFVVGHYQLGLLLLRNKLWESGLKSLQNALAIVKTKSPTELVQGATGLNYGRFAEILGYEINLYKTSGSQYVK